MNDTNDCINPNKNDRRKKDVNKIDTKEKKKGQRLIR